MFADICLDPQPFADKATALKAAGRLTSRIANNEANVSIRQLANAIGKGQTWTPATFGFYPTKGRKYRHLDAFIQLQFVAIDVDHGKFASLDEVLETCAEECLDPCIVHESFSSKSEHRKWRVIFQLDRPVKLMSTAYHVIGALAKPLEGDPACIEPARLLYGTTKDKVSLVDNGAITPLDYVLTLPAMKKPANTHDGKADHGGIKRELTAQERTMARLIVQDCIALIANPKKEKGSRHMALWTAARKLSQLEYFPTKKIHELLIKEMQKQKNCSIWADWDKSPEATIQNAIDWGRNHARQIEEILE